MEGIFHSFPYLHMIAVRDDLRGRGIGTELMDFFETVADFNPTAEAMYEHRGYVGLCELPGLFRRRVTEKLMMKTVTAS